MIRTLRFRFFVLVWPLVVVALVVLGALLGRWSTVELRRVSAELRHEQEIGDALERLADSLAPIPADDREAMQAAIDRIGASDSLARGAVVVAPLRGLLATGVRGLEPGDVTIGPGRQVDVRIVEEDEGSRTSMRVVSPGRPLDPADAADPRLLVVLPALTASVTALADTALGDAVPTTTLSRRIVIALVIGSVIAALVTLVMSGQLTGRVEKLAEGVRALGRGNLGARVPVEGGDEIAALAGSFNAMAGNLEASERQRRQMVSDVAHELRTPLTNLIGMVEAARDGLRPIDRDLLDTLAEEAGALNALVDDLRDLALADAGELRLAAETIDVAALAERVAASFAGNAEGVTIAVAAPTEAMVTGDGRRLGQVLRNLIQNAVTHSPKGGVVEVVVSPRPRNDGASSAEEAPPPALRAGAGKIWITIRDHGPGIAPEHLPRIWERFYRVDASRSRATGGMGLGLPVARRLIEAMGGSIAVESVVGEGTTFVVKLVTVTGNRSQATGNR